MLERFKIGSVGGGIAPPNIDKILNDENASLKNIVNKFNKNNVKLTVPFEMN